MSSQAVEVAGLVKAFSGREDPILDGLNLVIPTKSVHGLLGPNGAGKTTLTLLIAGLLRPTSGTITIFGDLATSRRARSRLVLLQDSIGAYDLLTVKEHVSYLVSLNHRKGGADAFSLIRRVGLESSSGSRVGKLSSGMKRRLGLALILAKDSELILLDEPTRGLDSNGLHLLRSLILEWKSAGRTVVVSTHITEGLGDILTGFSILGDGHLLRHEVGSLQSGFAGQGRRPLSEIYQETLDSRGFKT